MAKSDLTSEKDARAERLKKARKQKGFTSGEKAALRFAWNVNSYKAHESGRNGFDLDDAKRYAEAFEVSAAWLQTGEGEGPASVKPPEEKLWTAKLKAAVELAISEGAKLDAVHEEFERLLPMGIFRKLQLIADIGPDLERKAEAVASTTSGRSNMSDDDGKEDTSGSRRTP